ncbi:5-formyltetrahydrofolate cyclo-ligase [Arenimonas terrae]|uniref:5-formyltetrahydrofolate cyclo-ligase n=1 Tax=Arenimonas terrae TaxID=2546226 RepID=A0A5C4RX50_9GAMM|nr:5-formyltetrahydrofolate cyclo-ligase [Arenimonas terrae]TNJ35575.1 5-formyltetrahydrofolate cyclo-ligase [Arenimonas terrae]
MVEELLLDRTRAQLRADLRARRAALKPGERLAAADAVARHLGGREELRQPGYVGGYWAVNGELPLHAVQLRLAPGQVWCLPVVQADGGLRFAPWRAGDPLVPNRFGIPEPDAAVTLAPQELSLVLLPLLGFDRRGARLGMGGGYYDRAFAFRQQQPAPPHLVGVGYACQELPALPAEAWDVHLDGVATEDGFLAIGR